MNITMKTGLFLASLALPFTAFAADTAEFEFDRPGSGFGTAITPVGHLAWEQSLPSFEYDKSFVNGVQEKRWGINADMLLRTGLTQSLELQLGWQGPGWTNVKVGGQEFNDNGLGDVSVGLKKSIDLHDDKIRMAVLAKAQIATGNSGFSEHDNRYSLGSVVKYQFDDLVTTGITMRYDIQHGNWALNAIPTLEYKIANKWSGFSELVVRKAESQSAETSMATGVVYHITPRAQIDANVGFGLTDAAPDYTGGLGFAYLF